MKKSVIITLAMTVILIPVALVFGPTISREKHLLTNGNSEIGVKR